MIEVYLQVALLYLYLIGMGLYVLAYLKGRRLLGRSRNFDERFLELSYAAITSLIWPVILIINLINVLSE